MYKPWADLSTWPKEIQWALKKWKQGHCLPAPPIVFEKLVIFLEWQHIICIIWFEKLEACHKYEKEYK